MQVFLLMKVLQPRHDCILVPMHLCVCVCVCVCMHACAFPYKSTARIVGEIFFFSFLTNKMQRNTEMKYKSSTYLYLKSVLFTISVSAWYPVFHLKVSVSLQKSTCLMFVGILVNGEFVLTFHFGAHSFLKQRKKRHRKTRKKKANHEENSRGKAQKTRVTGLVCLIGWH